MATLRNGATNPDMLGSGGTTTVLTNFVGNSRGPATTYWNVSPGTGGSATREAVLTGGPDPRMPEGGGFIRYTQTVANTGGSCGVYYRDTAALTPGVAGDTRYWQAWVRPSVTRQMRMSGSFKDNAAADITTGTGAFTTCVGGEWTQLADLAITATGDYVKLQAWPVAIGPVAAGETIDVVAWVTQTPWPMFDGFTPNNDEFSTSWVGSAGVSLTTLTANTVTGMSNSAGTGGAMRVWQSLDAPMNSSRSMKSVQTVASTGGSAGIIYQSSVGGVAGDVKSASYWVKYNKDRYVRPLFRLRNGSTLVSTDIPGNTVFIPANTWGELKVEGIVANQDYTNMQVWPWIQAPTGNLEVGDTMQLARILLVDGAKLPADGWWDGDEPGSGKYVFAWDGAANASTSTRMDRLDIIHWWTRFWYGFLPAAYKEIDAVVQPENGSYPMLRFMDGAGQVSGQVRDLSDLMRSGQFTDPATTPDYAVRWLAQLMGVNAKQRAIDVPALRAYLLDLVASGRPAVGTTQSIVDAAKRFLIGDRQVTVIPSPTAAHTILVLARADEVPGTLAQLVTNIRSTGVVPAGHNLVAQYATASWDQYEAAAGATWTQADANQPTWRASESLGIVLE
ncbi:putative structural protein [Arthrobacter phage vB_ArtM-ArV1]|uniref:Putative structural protein n=1 Tax=Arthrobacter phage vB_ArtM-ArV1 TaxID=1566993 RepID=A0A0A7HAM1_9CAUD|nr:tail protein [Arthrobacter phage vB_ArtM-ArV1]AIZ01722.1 putative structural protein [Arthrobacter phage vB_ArtM-ArV1]